MKNLLILVSIVSLLFSTACAQNGGKKPKGMSFHGQTIEAKGAISAPELASVMKEKGGATDIKVQGTVQDVCQMKGCWMTMNVGEGEEMRIKFKDYGFFVPKDCSGKIAVMQGNAYYDTTSVEELVHLAVDGGMSEEEAKAKYTAPELTLNFEAVGVIIMEEKKKGKS
jgi:hypothetical protein